MNKIDSLISQKRISMFIDFATKLSFFSNKCVVITGGTGFVGSAIVRRLASVAKEVHLIARVSSSTERIQNVLTDVHMHRIVLDGATSLIEQVPEIAPNIIIHSAQPSSHGPKSLSDFITAQNVSSRMLTNVLEYARAMQVEKMIHLCSSMVYGSNEKDAFSETGPYNPNTYRGLVKNNERNLCRDYAKKFNLPVSLARVFRAYGPYDSAQKLIVNALERHNQKASIDLVSDHIVRDYIHVDDIVLAIAKMCEVPLTPGEEINLAGGKAYTAREIVTYLQQILRTTDLISEITYASSEMDKTFKQANISKAKRLINWEPKFDIKVGLQDVVNWYRSRS
ncbi:NAD-dependent epimerase/dehydratase family protein [Roseivirga sp.]|uniref:NAD-dependent epimerase/dehydratase family protein n=1 Tax=Roseivirga sp. TaxID=1964215 RepID=UPI003B8CD185